MPNTTQNLASNVWIAASAGSGASPALDPWLRLYLESRWRSCWQELRQIAPMLGWSDRLPQKVN